MDHLTCGGRVEEMVLGSGGHIAIKVIQIDIALSDSSSTINVSWLVDYNHTQLWCAALLGVPTMDIICEWLLTSHHFHKSRLMLFVASRDNKSFSH